MVRVGLRIDVDTLRGTRTGVPNLLDLLPRYGIRGSFFFSVGPDNMGRHLWRLLRPAFLAKMRRTRAASLYGWDILLRGTLFPGPVIGKQCPGPIWAADEKGHEIGLHAWDHHHWQTHLESLDLNELAAEIQRGYNLLTDILGRHPDCFAAPGWRVTPDVLFVLNQLPFRFQSDCRGWSVFHPALKDQGIPCVQVPTTLPTYDEVVGLKCSPKTYNAYLLEMIRPDRLNVLTIHAEVEGISRLALFKDFLEQAGRREISFVPLGDLLSRSSEIIESAIVNLEIPGREGWISCQEGHV